MAKCRLWLSYDFGIKGDYENMYYWLDKQQAKECGDSTSTFLFTYKDINNIKAEVKQSLEDTVTFTKKDRVYLIYKDSEGGYSGSFILGARKASPWEGVSTISSSDDN